MSHSARGVEEIIGRCEALFEDLEFSYVKKWKEKHKESKAIGFMPVYVPREIIYAGGALPVGIMGGGDQMEIIRGDSYFQSYICHIPRSTIELGLTEKLDLLDGMIFPSTCDVIRNLSGMWKLLFPNKYVKYFDVPQNFDPNTGGKYYLHELESLQKDVELLCGRSITNKALNNSIFLYNQNRELVSKLYSLRREKPWMVLTTESYLLLRAGNILDVVEHNDMLNEYLLHVVEMDRRPLDNSRVLLRGAFCEQPPLNLIKTLERAGCYIVEDDFVLVSRWISNAVETGATPLQNLCDAFLSRSVETSIKYDDQNNKGQLLLDSIKRTRADGVIFCAASFCDPALLDQPMLTSVLDKEGVPYTQFKYSENTGQFQTMREQAGTFSDSVKLWGGS